MNSSRKLKRNKLRAEVGNKGLKQAWKNEKAEVLLAERKQVVKARKKAIKKDTSDRQYLGRRKMEIDKQLKSLDYDFKLKRVFV